MARDGGNGEAAVGPLTEGDVTRQAELVVMEYLKGTRCAKTLDAIISHGPSVSSMSPISSDLYAIDLDKKKKVGAKTVLDYMVARLGDESPNEPSKPPALSAPLDKILSRTTSSNSSTSSRRRASTDDGGDEIGALEWTRDEVYLLKKAIKLTSNLDDKNERWKEIANIVGHGKTKKHCYLKYKELKDEKGSAQPSSSERPSSRRSSSEGMGRDQKSSQGARNAPAIKINSNETVADKWSSGNAEDELEYVMKRISPPVTHGSTAAMATELLEVEDCDDFESAPAVRYGHGRAQVTAPLSSSTIAAGRSPSVDEVESLRDILFPEDRKGFSSHWEEQGFFFSEVRDLRYGLLQHQGGPCGVLAVVQAFVLRFLFETVRPSDWRNPSQRDQEHALVEALAHILWQSARGSRRADCSIVVNDDKVLSSSTKRRFMAGMQLFTAKSVEQTKSFIGHHVRQFMAPKGNGLVLLVLSVLLSKRVATIRLEMDSVEGAFGGGGKLIGGHDYCTQEIVNLLLCGVASSNVFDGKQLLEGTSEDDPKAVMLKGIPARSDLGFLSLFEAYEYIVVGNHLKRPRFNVWVVCSESHYSVLFADPRLLLNQDIHEKMAKLDMFYFDGLGSQDEEIRLTVHASALSERSKPKPDDLVPPLNLVLQTKWPLARIDWNGVDPLL